MTRRRARRERIRRNRERRAARVWRVQHVVRFWRALAHRWFLRKAVGL